jgi:hypothetical protein
MGPPPSSKSEGISISHKSGHSYELVSHYQNFRFIGGFCTCNAGMPCAVDSNGFLFYFNPCLFTVRDKSIWWLAKSLRKH